MSNPILTEIATLFQETDVLLESPNPDTSLWERYSQRRQEIFAHLQDLLQQELQCDQAALQNALHLVLEKDQVLLQHLDLHRSRCRQELAAIAKANQALNHSPALLPQLVDCDV